jgi:hypothetical protein
VAEPTTAEWWAAGGAAGLLVLVGGLLLIRPRRRAGVAITSRIAGWFLACAASAVLVVAAVVGTAGWKATSLDPAARGEDRPATAFAQYLIDSNPDSTERAAAYGLGVLVPLAAVLAVLALATVDPARPTGLRLIAAALTAALLVLCLFVVAGDAGPLAARAAMGIAGLASGALLFLVLDELTHRNAAPPMSDAAPGE